MGNIPLVHEVTQFLKDTKSHNNEASWSNMSFTEFLNCIREMNKRCFRNQNEAGEYLCFAINKSDIDCTFWKQRLRIRCFKINSQSNSATAQKDLTLDEFMNAFNVQKAMSGTTSNDTMMKSMEVLGDTSLDGLCCICMDNMNEILLPCLHSFCLACISQLEEYRPAFKCPLCNQRIENPVGNSWEVPDPPLKDEVAQYLESLTDKPSSSNSRR